MIDVDDAGSIGRRYRRQDEVGTPLCVTIDFDTLDDRAVTVRDRDTMAQDRVPLDRLVGELRDRLGYGAMTDGRLLLAARHRRRRVGRRHPRRVPRHARPRSTPRATPAKADAAALNKAWNVLSDPYQRGRYDEQRVDRRTATTTTTRATTTTTATPARGRASAGAPRATAAAPSKRAQGRGEPAASRRSRCPPARTSRRRAKRASSRWSSTSSCCSCSFIGSQFVVAAASRSRRSPSVVPRRHDALPTRSEADSASNKANKARRRRQGVSAARRRTTPTQQTSDQKASDDAKTADRPTLDEAARRRSKQARRRTSSPVIALAFFLGAPVSRRSRARSTGQTLGKRLQHLKVAARGRLAARLARRVHALRARSSSSTFVLVSTCCGPIAAVHRAVRRHAVDAQPEQQGLHDRFAQTIVVTRRRSNGRVRPEPASEASVDVGAMVMPRSTSTRSKRAARSRSSCSAARARTSPR